MGIGVILIFLIIFGLALGAMTFLAGDRNDGHRGSGCLPALVIAVVPILAYVLFHFYQNRPRSPETHWEEAFGEVPPDSIVFSAAEGSFTNDAGSRAIWFKADPTTIAAFAKRQNFVFQASGPDGGVEDTDYTRSRYHIRFPTDCKQVERYNAPDYFKSLGGLRIAELYYCPSSGDAEIILAWID
ncbi:MAG: hypothetical protein EP335_02360 [Alphaproteobacteria bacterium]|nr:MAG: hypothetical protein EP335_02360 [Alphaproteobacteria bacterium]